VGLGLVGFDHSFFEVDVHNVDLLTRLLKIKFVIGQSEDKILPLHPELVEMHEPSLSV